MSPENEFHEIPQEDWKDAVYELSKLGTGMLFGPLGALLFGKAVLKPYQKKMQLLLEDVVIKLKNMEQEKQIDLDKLFETVEFQSVFGKFLRISENEHNEEKLAYLKNALFNSVTLESVELNIKLIILSTIEKLTSDHIRILHFWHSPKEWIERNGKKIDYDNVAPGYGYIFEKYFPVYVGRKSFYHKLHAALQADHLIEKIVFSNASDDWHHSKTTAFGKQFLEFISQADSEIVKDDTQ